MLNIGHPSGMTEYRLRDGRVLELRLAQDNDMGEAADTFRKVASEGTFLDTETVPPETEELWKERWKENGKDMLFIIGTVEGKIIGGLVLTKYSRSDKSRHVRTLGMWLLKEFRGLKAGSSMIDYAVDWCKSHNVRKINLGVFSSNMNALKLYLGKGFSIEGSLRDNALVNGSYVDEIVMGLELG